MWRLDGQSLRPTCWMHGKSKIRGYFHDKNGHGRALIHPNHAKSTEFSKHTKADSNDTMLASLSPRLLLTSRRLGDNYWMEWKVRLNQYEIKVQHSILSWYSRTPTKYPQRTKSPLPTSTSNSLSGDILPLSVSSPDSVSRFNLRLRSLL